MLTSMTYPEFLIHNLRYWEHHKVFPYDKYHVEPSRSKFFLDMLETALHRLECAMSPAKKAKANKQTDYANIEFVNINLTVKQKDTFKSWYAEVETELPNLLAAFIGAGYKTAIRFDNENECFIVSSTCIDESMENGGKCLTSRSDDWLEALALNLYKTDTISENGIWESSSNGKNWG